MVDPAPPPSGAQGTGTAGQVLAGRYRLERPIASGGMARVWEATDEILSRPVAVKVLHGHLAADAAFVARFRAEAVNAARLSHPAIVSVYDTWTGDGVEAIVMELVRGTTLRHLLDRRGRLDPDDAIVVAGQIAAALEHAHAAGIIHRDVKPANVLLSDEGRVLVTDFGIAKATEGADLTTEQAMLGTAKYLAPEQVESGPVDARTDLYALGVVLYEMLCGQPPFRAESEAATALARLHRAPEPPRSLRPELSPSLEDVVLHLLARRPQDRCPDAATARSALLGADAGLDATRAAIPASDATAATRAGGGGWGPAPRAAEPPGPVPYPGHPVEAGPPGSPGHVPVLHEIDDWEPADPQPQRRRRRRTGPVVVAALIGSALIVLVLLAVALRPDGVGPGTGGVAAISGAGSFDPAGDNKSENEDAARLAVDGDRSTAWTTEHYRDPDIATYKGGVGLVTSLERGSDVDRITVTSPSAGWSAQVFAVDGDLPSSLEGWGKPVAEQAGMSAGETSFDVERRATAVLIWITRTADDGRVEIAEIAVD